MKIKILYFARLKDAFGVAQEVLETESKNVDQLLEQLLERGGIWREELSGGQIFRVAVNQELASGKTLLSDADEVAIFPPVTGG